MEQTLPEFKWVACAQKSVEKERETQCLTREGLLESLLAGSPKAVSSTGDQQDQVLAS